MDTLELLFELVDRVAFYARDYWSSNWKEKNIKKMKRNKSKISNPIGDLDGFEVINNRNFLFLN